MKTIKLPLIIFTVLTVNIYSQYEVRSRIPRDIQFDIQQFDLETPQENIDEAMLDSLITNIMEINHIPGTQVLIVKHDEIIWSKNYGYANVEQSKPVEDSTLFIIASISKPFISTAIMQLWEDGLLNLDDNINDYLLPDFQVINPTHPNDTITVSMLMTHTSSINDNWDILWPLKNCGDSPISLDSLFVFGLENEQGFFKDFVDLDYLISLIPELCLLFPEQF